MWHSSPTARTALHHPTRMYNVAVDLHPSTGPVAPPPSCTACLAYTSNCEQTAPPEATAAATGQEQAPQQLLRSSSSYTQLSDSTMNYRTAQLLPALPNITEIICLLVKTSSPTYATFPSFPLKLSAVLPHTAAPGGAAQPGCQQNHGHASALELITECSKLNMWSRLRKHSMP